MADMQMLKLFKEAVDSAEYQLIRERQVEMIIGLAQSNIDPVELKGMMKLIAKTDTWRDEYDKELKKK